MMLISHFTWLDMLTEVLVPTPTLQLTYQASEPISQLGRMYIVSQNNRNMLRFQITSKIQANMTNFLLFT